jgi:hypothetical protein
MNKSYTTSELIAQLYDNLRCMAPQGAESQYIAGYLNTALKEIVEGGIDELVAHVDWTNQRVEAKRNVLKKLQINL